MNFADLAPGQQFRFVGPTRYQKVDSEHAAVAGPKGPVGACLWFCRQEVTLVEPTEDTALERHELLLKALDEAIRNREWADFESTNTSHEIACRVRYERELLRDIREKLAATAAVSASR